MSYHRRLHALAWLTLVTAITLVITSPLGAQANGAPETAASSNLDTFDGLNITNPPKNVRPIAPLKALPSLIDASRRARVSLS